MAKTTKTTVLVGIALLVLVGGGLGVAVAAPGADAPESTEMSNHSGNATDMNNHSEPSQIQVSASADVSATPDIATVRLAVTATGDTAEAARNQVAENASDMRAALRDIGVGDDQVQTTYYDISAVHEETRNGTEIVGYRAAHGFEIEVNVNADDLGERTGTLIDTAVQNGANQIEGVEFTLAEDTRRAMRQQALEHAMENARHDATVLAASSDLTITGVTSVSTADVGISPFQGARQELAADTAGTVIEPGPVTVSATVSVTYSAEALTNPQENQTTATGADVTVAHGGTATVTVSAASVTRLQIAAPSTEAIELLGFNQATIEPAPDRVLESLPPIWEWDSTVREVSVTLPVSTPDDIAPGKYRFTVKATGGSSDQTAEAPLNVRVTAGNTTAE